MLRSTRRNLHVNTSIPMQDIKALTLSGETLAFKSISVIFYILYSRVSEAVTNLSPLFTKCSQHYLYQQISIGRHHYTHMLQSIEGWDNVMCWTKNWCLICTTRNDKVGRRTFLAHCKGKWLPWDAMNEKSVYTSVSRFFNAAHVNMLWPTYSTDN